MTSPRARVARLEKQVQAMLARQTEAQSNELERFSRYRDDLFGFCRDTFLDQSLAPKGYWPGSKAILEATIKHRRVTIRSARKGTKTETLADLIIAFLQTGPCIVVSTAAGGRQVETGLWSRVVAQYHRTRVPLLGECLKTRLNVAPNWYGIGFSTRDSGRFLGFHSGVDIPEDADVERAELATPDEVAEQIDRAAHEVRKRSSTARLAMLFDEAPHIDPKIYEAARGSLLGDRTYFVLAGNPHLEFEDAHDYARSHHAGSGFHRIKITAPEEADEEPDPVDADETFVIPSWLAKPEDYAQQYPKGTPLFNPDARGRFQSGDVSGRVIPYAVLRFAAEPRPTNLKRGAHIGVDTAAEGDDANVMSLVVDHVLVSVDRWHSPDTIATWERIQRVRKHWSDALGEEIPWSNCHIDDAPIAKGIIDIARRQKCFLDCVAFGGEARNGWREHTGDVSYLNQRAELYWSLRELLRLGLACIPDKYTDVWRELASANYTFTTAGKLQIEPKKDIKARLGRSPDYADSVALAFAKTPRVVAFRM